MDWGAVWGRGRMSSDAPNLPIAKDVFPHLHPAPPPPTWQVLLPHSCLAAFAMSLGELPATLILRLTHRGPSVCVGVADFVDDQRVLQASTSATNSATTSATTAATISATTSATWCIPGWCVSHLGSPTASSLVTFTTTTHYHYQYLYHYHYHYL